MELLKNEGKPIDVAKLYKSTTRFAATQRAEELTLDNLIADGVPITHTDIPNANILEMTDNQTISDVRKKIRELEKKKQNDKSLNEKDKNEIDSLKSYLKDNSLLGKALTDNSDKKTMANAVRNNLTAFFKAIKHESPELYYHFKGRKGEPDFPRTISGGNQFTYKPVKPMKWSIIRK